MISIPRLFYFGIPLLFASCLFAADQPDPAFATDLMADQCDFAAEGRNSYFVLEPGYQAVFMGIDDEDTVSLVISVTGETEIVGSVTTRIVEERESVNGELVEVSRNYFALCRQTNSIYYFGEAVDMYEDGKVVRHEGSWRADTEGAKPGVMMPGLILPGARYYQEIAPGVAMDRAEIVDNRAQVDTPAGRFINCLKVEETTDLEPGAREYKYYAPAVGLIKDGNLLLIRSGLGVAR